MNIGGLFIITENEPKLQLITEGKTKLWVVKTAKNMQKNQKMSGPGDRKVAVFFNPVMEFSRDLSIMVIDQIISEKMKKSGCKIKLIDGLAGTGARGVRVCAESKNLNAGKIESSMTINDHNPVAHKIIKKNIELNNLDQVNASNNDLNSLLGKSKFDYIDIDPFGSPIKFLDGSTRALRNSGYLAVSATDTGTLFGTYPKTCLRRYDAISSRMKCSHEMGIRILVGACVRAAAKYNMGLRPVLIHATDYYYRLYLHGTKSRSYTDDCLAQMGYVLHKKNSNNYKIIQIKELLSLEPSHILSHWKNEQNKDLKVTGPLWLGPLFERSFVCKLSTDTYKFGTGNQIDKMLALWSEEAEAPLGFYDANSLASELKMSTPRLSKILGTLTDHGYFVSKTHFNPNAFKTNAGFEEIVQIFRSLG